MAKEKIVRKKMKRKKKSKIYFGMECQNAIVEFNGLPKEPKYDIQRQKIYQDRIHAPFDKLVENIIHTFKFYYFDVSSEDVKNEVVSNLYMNMGKYDPDKGRAFSYFSVMAKNYLIHNNNKNYKMYKTHDEIGELDFKRDVANESSRQDTKEFNRDFMDSLINYWDNNIFTIFYYVCTLPSSRSNICMTIFYLVHFISFVIVDRLKVYFSQHGVFYTVGLCVLPISSMLLLSLPAYEKY